MHALFETLEPRTLRAADPAPAVAIERFGETLVIEGTPQRDVINVRPGKADVLSVSVGDGPVVYHTQAARVNSIEVHGGGGTDEVRVDFSFHTITHTRSVETRRVYIKSGTRLTGDYAVTPLEGVLHGTTARWLAHDRAQRAALTPADKKARVLFMGDSMAERFVTTGLPAWDALLRPRGAVDLGSTGDTTGNVLYRIATGLLDGFAPRVVVLAIGANNIDRSDDAESTLRGIREITRQISARLPDTKILIAGVFPRRRAFENNRVTTINAALKTWDDGAALRVLDLTPHFASDPVREDLFRPNDIHLNARGYRLWANLLTPVLDEMTG